jgi:hypothetical protein
MRNRDQQLYDSISERLARYEDRVGPLPGLSTVTRRDAFLSQVTDSVRRTQYPGILVSRAWAPTRADPTSLSFNPLYAAAYHLSTGDVDEACWMIFLFVHFGRHLRGGWRYVTEVYGNLGEQPFWSWNKTSADPGAFREWLREHQAELTRAGAGFGNHRKYESMADSSTGGTVESYVGWVGDTRSHRTKFAEAVAGSEGSPIQAFDALYQSMGAVARFGRTARFDYLTMIGNMGIARILPGKAYLDGATGPRDGTKKLLGVTHGARISTAALQGRLNEIGSALGVGMQVLEDSLCNWQKTPDHYVRFKG